MTSNNDFDGFVEDGQAYLVSAVLAQQQQMQQQQLLELQLQQQQQQLQQLQQQQQQQATQPYPGDLQVNLFHPFEFRGRGRTSTACVYCHRSHLQCGNERPCPRCVKRNIGPLCRDSDENELAIMLGAHLKSVRESTQAFRRARDIITNAFVSSQPIASNTENKPVFDCTLSDRPPLCMTNIVECVSNQIERVLGPWEDLKLTDPEHVGDLDSVFEPAPDDIDALLPLKIRLSRLLYVKCKAAYVDTTDEDIAYCVGFLMTSYMASASFLKIMGETLTPEHIQYVLE